MELDEKIIAAQKAKNLSDEEMARKLGINDSYYNDFLYVDKDIINGYDFSILFRVLIIVGLDPIESLGLKRQENIFTNESLTKLVFQRIEEKQLTHEQIEDLLNAVGDIESDIREDMRDIDYLYYEDLLNFFNALDISIVHFLAILEEKYSYLRG